MGALVGSTRVGGRFGSHLCISQSAKDANHSIEWGEPEEEPLTSAHSELLDGAAHDSSEASASTAAAGEPPLLILEKGRLEPAAVNLHVSSEQQQTRITRQLQLDAVGCRHALSVITVPCSKPCCCGVSSPPEAMKSSLVVCVSMVQVLFRAALDVVPLCEDDDAVVVVVVGGRSGVPSGEVSTHAVPDLVAAAAFCDNLNLVKIRFNFMNV